ncbi:TPA: ArpU family transcriptional regulator, partial [Streptococcus pyogenes]
DIALLAFAELYREGVLLVEEGVFS